MVRRPLAIEVGITIDQVSQGSTSLVVCVTVLPAA